MNIKHYLQPWLLISIGILMNIVSAVMTHYFINQNNSSIQKIGQQKLNIESHIKSQWQLKTELERKKEFSLLLLTYNQKDSLEPLIQQYLLQHLKSVKQISQQTNTKQATLTIKTIINATQQAQAEIVNNINNQYLEKLELQEEQSKLTSNNSSLYSIAIFMQIIGLILVLSRDLART